jgi:hypothetical protein
MFFKNLKLNIIFGFITFFRIQDLGNPKATTLFHTSLQRSMTTKNNKLIVLTLMNTNIKLGEKKRLER